MEPKLNHRAEYERRLHRVLTYIDQHLDEPISLARLAKEANFSAFHFHRIFAALVGETLGTYLTRRRVEQAASRLASQPKLGVLNVALSVGFGSAEAFSRAFKKHFGCSPSQWKLQGPKGRKQNRKISQVKSSLDQERRGRNGYRSRMDKTTTALAPLSVSIITRPPVRIAYLRYQGPFGAPLGDFWGNTVYPWMVENGLMGSPRYGVSQDDPQVTANDKCRYDAGVEVGKDFVPSQNAKIATLPGGLYASIPFWGRSDEIKLTWERILREWLPASGYQLDARPCFEYYPPDGKYDEKTGKFSCDLCIPVAKL